MEKERENLNFQSQNNETYNLPFKLSELKNSLDKSNGTTAGPDDIRPRATRGVEIGGCFALVAGG